MKYKSYDQEWDDTWGTMKDLFPKIGDKVLCASLEVEAGEVVDTRFCSDAQAKFYVVRLINGDIDEFAREDVLVRSAA